MDTKTATAKRAPGRPWSVESAAATEDAMEFQVRLDGVRQKARWMTTLIEHNDREGSERVWRSIRRDLLGLLSYVPDTRAA